MRSLMEGILVMLLDIEGTTTPIDFVHKNLFDFADENLEAFLAENARLPEVRNCIIQLRAIHAADTTPDKKPAVWETGHGRDINSAAEYGRFLIGKDRKDQPLKLIEGLIWKQGYDSGKLRGVVYDDVPAAMKRWNHEGKQIYIYSSGSVLSQELIFSTTRYGDLTKYISGYFDTAVGKKTDTESFRKISDSLGCPVGSILFISDSIEELRAANNAGILVVHISRESKFLVDNGGFPEISNFEELDGL